MKPYGLYPADIWLPSGNPALWPVVACDQFTSQKAYWETVERLVGDAPSTLRITLPEVYLTDRPDERIREINRTMRRYLNDGVLREYPDSMIYVERTQSDGRIRRGLVGMIDLEQYDYRPSSQSAIRATEQTVLERIPPRVKIRENAVLELPHVLLLMDDPEKTVIEPLSGSISRFPLAYDTPLMQQGGHVTGRFLDEAAKDAVAQALTALGEKSDLLFVVGDGNHSLATAKECYRKHPTPLSRYALVEVVNLHDPSIEFEPIYRVLFNVDPAAVLHELTASAGTAEGHEVTALYGEQTVRLTLEKTAELPVETLQTFLDAYLMRHPEASIDYIHGAETVKTLSRQPRTLGFLFRGMTKETLFPAVKADGSLPRKTFSMGHAPDKRYYMECRKIQEG